MDVPARLQRKMDLYRSNGRILREDNELFAEASWLQVMQGQRVEPRGHHPFADLIPEAHAKAFIDDVERVVAKCVDVMPTHAEFIAANCKA
jgi:tryptophan halogenase